MIPTDRGGSGSQVNDRQNAHGLCFVNEEQEGVFLLKMLETDGVL